MYHNPAISTAIVLKRTLNARFSAGTLLTFLLFFNLLFSSGIFAQDTLKESKAISYSGDVPKLHSPHKATIYALVLPGLGQAYNHKYWKLPIVYAGFGVMYYFIHTNTKFYRDFKEAYEWSAFTQNTIYPPTPVNFFKPPPAAPNEYATKYTSSQLLEAREYYRRNLEVSYIATGAWYLLTVVDAVVDAHFFDYDISEELALEIKPWSPCIGYNQPNALKPTGITLQFHF